MYVRWQTPDPSQKSRTRMTDGRSEAQGFLCGRAEWKIQSELPAMNDSECGIQNADNKVPSNVMSSAS